MLDIVIIICLAIGLIKGLFDGFIKQVISFVGILVAILSAGAVAVPLKEFLSELFTEQAISDSVLTWSAYVLAFIVIIIACSIIGKIISKVINMTPAKPLNIMLGAMFGVFWWIVCLSIVFNVLASFEKNLEVIPKQTKENSVLYEGVKDVLPTIFPVIKNYFDTYIPDTAYV
ncbi:membrane protein required for colicin V production [Dysgonomonadaceae bacterium PH5-43]|nr:membrane protein required for colicin V production [Dysgonomonadaceae bacterium PH5-43]